MNTNAKTENLSSRILIVARGFKGTFTTEDFISKFGRKCPLMWARLLSQYGPYGKNAGRPYTAASRVAGVLTSLAHQKLIKKLRYVPASSDWGNPSVRTWRA